MATDPEKTDEETEVPAPEVADDQVTSPTATDESGTAPDDKSDVPPEQVTPAAGGENVEVPSAAGPAGPPSNAGNSGNAVVAAEADEASPTGGANVAGTPASQLSQAPPMTDESGSNIPAPNLVQPIAPDALPEGQLASADALDPALVNPDEAAKARVEGRTSDAATRAEGTHIDSVPPDLNEGPKPSDGGPEAYPFPQGGDVDIATVPEHSGDQEYWPALTLEDTVVLGEHDLVPERLVGRRAFISDAPRYLVPVGEEDRVWITVKTRDEVSATLTIPLSAVTIERGGRSPLVRG